MPNKSKNHLQQELTELRIQNAQLKESFEKMISDRKLVEQELKASNKRFKSLISASQTGAWIFDLDKKFLWCSEEYFSMLGRDIKDYDLSGKPNLNETWLNLLHEEDRDDAEKVFSDYLLNPSGMYENYFRMKHLDGSIIWILSRGKAIFDEQTKKPIRCVGTHINITSQKLLEDQLRFKNEELSKSEKNLRQLNEDLLLAKEEAIKSEANIIGIIEGSNSRIWAYDKNLRLQFLNKKFRQEYYNTFGILLKPGMHILDVLPTHLHATWKPLYERVLNNEQFLIEDRLITKKGAIYVEIIFNPILKDGKVIGGSCIGSDITERKLNVIQLTEAKEKAEESDRLKSAFLANMSHEIRTPMNGILGFTELLLQPNLSGEKKDRYIKIVQQSGQRMLTTVNDIIELSKIQANIVQVKLEETNVCKRIIDLINFFRPEAEKKGIELIIEKLPQEPCRLKTDINKFDSIVTNLLKNAIKFTTSGYIKIACYTKGAALEFYIEDTGSGIAAERQLAIFNRFEQENNHDSVFHEGTGLGLAITKSYVEMLNGNIWLESEVGKGSKFFFNLPFEMNLKEKLEATNSINEGSDKKPLHSEKIKILIVEDDNISMNLLSLIVKNIAIEILTASNGLEAVEICRNNPDIELILMDIKMPIMDGFDATLKIREFNNVVKIIAQTALVISGDRKKLVLSGFDDYVMKPINKNKLLKVIGKHFKDLQH